MKKHIFILVILILLAFGIGVVLSRYWHQKITVTSQVGGEQEPTSSVTPTATGKPLKNSVETASIETPEQVEREISEIIEHLEAIHAPAKEREEIPPVPTDPVAVASERLKFIAQNPQQWGVLSSDATELMAQLSPTRDTMTEGGTEEVIDSLMKLGNLRDPRSAEIFVNYIRESGLWGKPMEEALIAIGPPSVPPLIPLLDTNARLKGKLIAPTLLSVIGSEHRHELGGAVEYIILPKLEKLATTDSNPLVRQYASEAIGRLK